MIEELFVRTKVRKAVSLDSLNSTVFSSSSSSRENRAAAAYRNGRGSSLLHIAAYFGNVPVVQDLIGTIFILFDSRLFVVFVCCRFTLSRDHADQGLDPWERNDSRWSSAHYLCRFHQPLNQRLSLAVQTNGAKGFSARAFRGGFNYSVTKRNQTQSK